jgi:hypothetical protein
MISDCLLLRDHASGDCGFDTLRTATKAFVGPEHIHDFSCYVNPSAFAMNTPLPAGNFCGLPFMPKFGLFSQYAGRVNAGGRMIMDIARSQLRAVRSLS